ncbi:hypothetical protein CH371_14720 [Leptospira wolffii]|uniref:Uncharacterized protein n=1 Tax=Leptospira wolffii TaxID=409998 RepID=A0A2M9Z9Y8_9LEPT|nr:hypothetical protein [Leptospira wolffii]PJZ65172.1 hypothetical protein CH371_14720 [Leptospira wolffii]
MLPIPPNPIEPNKASSPNRSERLPETHRVSFYADSASLFKNPELFDGESKEAPFFRVWVKEGTRDGRVQLFWKGKTLDADTKTPLLTGESIVLVRNQTSPSFEWKIQERKLTDDENASEVFSPVEKGLAGALEKILSHEEGPASQDAILSFLKSYFPFLEWKPDTPVFDWEWEDGKAEGYLDQEGSDKIFVLFMETPQDGPSLYRFHWKKEDASDLVLTAVYTSSKMYLHMGRNRKKFKQFLEDLGIRIQEVRIEWKPSLQRREWTA